jgi:hypothetical protein
METIDIWGVDEGIEKVIIRGVSIRILINTAHVLISFAIGICAFLTSIYRGSF